MYKEWLKMVARKLHSKAIDVVLPPTAHAVHTCCCSNSPSNPSIGFGSSVRDASLHQYLSPEHAKAMSGNNSQGPVYKVYVSAPSNSLQ